MEFKPSAASPSPSTPSVSTPKADSFSVDADIRTITGQFEGLTESQRENLSSAVEHFSSLEPKSNVQPITPNEARKSEAKVSNLLDKFETKRLEKLMDKLDPAFNDLNHSVGEFNKKANELGVDNIFNNKKLSHEQKQAKINDLFDKNPDFKRMHDDVLKNQNRYLRVSNGIRNTINRANVRALSKADYAEYKKKLKREPDEPHKGINNTIDRLTLAILETIKRIFGKDEPKLKTSEMDANGIENGAQQSSPSPNAPHNRGPNATSAHGHRGPQVQVPSGPSGPGR